MATKTAVAKDNWQAQADMRTLAEANKVRSDPKRMAACRQCAKEQLASVEKGEGKPDLESMAEDKGEVMGMGMKAGGMVKGKKC